MEAKQLAVIQRQEKRTEKQITTTLGKFHYLLKQLVDTLGVDDPNSPVLQTVSKHGDRYTVTGDTLNGCIVSLTVYLED